MTIDFLAHVRRESGRFAEVMLATDPAAPVPTCPGWTAADLLWHLAEVQLFWGTVVRERLDDPERAEVGPDRPASYGALLSLFDDASAALIDALESTGDDVPVWTWFDSDQSAGFVRRRQAHEALIHRLDAELTAGVVPDDVDLALATDGVAEVLDWMFSGVPDWAEHVIDGPIGRLDTTDTDAEWLVRIGRFSGTSPNTGNSYADEPTLTLVEAGEPTFTVTGNARDLDAWLWNRPTLMSVLAEGADVARFRAIIDSGVQ